MEPDHKASMVMFGVFLVESLSVLPLKHLAHWQSFRFCQAAECSLHAAGPGAKRQLVHIPFQPRHILEFLTQNRTQSYTGRESKIIF